MRLLNTLIVLAGGALLVPLTVSADTPGHHPHYLHVRGDLQECRFLLRGPVEPNVERNFRAADAEVDAAIRSVNRAAALDAKDVYSPAHPDEHIDRIGRFRNLMRLLEKCRKDLAAQEDNPVAREAREEAFRHIDAAMDFVRRAARDAHIDRQLGW
jgi:hypothetical protein